MRWNCLSILLIGAGCSLDAYLGPGRGEAAVATGCRAGSRHSGDTEPDDVPVEPDHLDPTLALEHTVLPELQESAFPPQPARTAHRLPSPIAPTAAAAALLWFPPAFWRNPAPF